MSIVFTDSFTVGSDTALESYPSAGDPDYANISGADNLDVNAANDRVQGTTSGADEVYRIIDAAVPTGNQKISANCGVTTGYSCGYLGVRGSASFNAYLLTRASNTTWELWRIDAGSWTLLTSWSVSTTDSTTQAIAIKAEGTGATVTLTPTIAGSDRTAYNDSAASRKTSGTPCVAVYQTSVVAGNFVDDVSVDDLAAAGAVEASLTMPPMRPPARVSR